MWGARTTRQSGKAEPDHALGRGDLHPSVATAPGYTAWCPRYELSRSADRDIRIGDATRVAGHCSAATLGEGCNRSIEAAAPITKPAHRCRGSALPAAAPDVGAGTFCSGVGAAGHHRWRLTPRERGWRAPAAGLPGIGGEAFCPDVGAPGHRRRGFLPCGRGWGAPAAGLPGTDGEAFCPGCGARGHRRRGFLPSAQGSRRCAQGSGRCAQGPEPCEQTIGAGIRACHAWSMVSSATARPALRARRSGPGRPPDAQLRPR